MPHIAQPTERVTTPNRRLRDTNRVHIVATVSAGLENGSSSDERHFVHSLCSQE